LMAKKTLGYLHVYTGDGKGKTTAALGLGMRAAGHGLKVVMVQFLKGQINYGELESAKRIPGFEIRQFGRAEFVDRKNPAKVDVELAKDGLKFAQGVLAEGSADLLILDELNTAIDWGLVTLSDAVDMLRARPDGMEIVVTGRYAAREIIQMADLVTEMKEVQHPFQKGVLGREGIEF
jgi:cob(I)alamin adenosyltransferase